MSADKDQFYKEVILPNADAVFNYAMKLHNYDVHKAEDLASDTLVKAVSKMDKFTHKDNPKGWLFTICYHLFTDAYRKGKRGPQIAELDVNRVSGEDDDYGQSFVEYHIDPRTASGYGDEVERALAVITEEYRDIILLVAEEASYQEIADALDIPLNTVRTRIWRARKKLYNLLGMYAKNIGFFSSTNDLDTRFASNDTAVVEPKKKNKS